MTFKNLWHTNAFFFWNIYTGLVLFRGSPEALLKRPHYTSLLIYRIQKLTKERIGSNRDKDDPRCDARRRRARYSRETSLTEHDVRERFSSGDDPDVCVFRGSIRFSR